MESADQFWNDPADVLSSTVHEIRNTLFILSGLAGLIDRQPGLDGNERREAVAALRRNCGRLEGLFRGLLLVARADAFPVQLVDTDALPLLSIAAHVAIARGAVVEVHCPPELRLRTNADRLHDVLAILVENACSYGRPPVLISASVGATETSVAVSGTGEAIGSRAQSLDVCVARWLARSVQGDLQYVAGARRGSFVLTLPRARHPSEHLARGFDVSDVLRDVCEWVTLLCDDVDTAGASVLVDSGQRFVIALDEVTHTLERVQHRLQQGPGVDAARSGKEVLVADLATTHRNGVYEPTALKLGIHAVAAMPLRAGKVIGWLNLYRYRPGPWADGGIATARAFAEMAARSILNASELQQQRRLTEQLEEALQSRIVIEQAKGMIASHYGCSIDQAFERLRSHARKRSANIHEVAQAVITLGLRP